MSHKALKDTYRNTSKRIATSMEETFWKGAGEQNQLFAGKSGLLYND